MTSPFPFSAIVGQDEMKLAVLIAAVDPSVGGVLIFGDRGTGKSTAVRALAGLLPKMTVVAGCRYGCDPDAAAACPAAGAEGGEPAEGPGGGRTEAPRGRKAARDGASLPGERSQVWAAPSPPPEGVKKTWGGPAFSCEARVRNRTAQVPVPVVDLPLGATEDRVVGALDIERALSQGVKVFEPGLLAQAHRGFLYIDEVNLLEDHLVDLLIDVAASGVNVVEREGLSVRHPARFVLVGSGNPEEGELRPQLQDRFGLAVDVRTPQDLATRVEVIRRRDAYERDPQAFAAAWKKEEDRTRKRLVAARKRLPEVTVPDAALERAAQLCMALGTDGLRGELTLMRSARALAALDGVAEVGDAQLRQVARPALRHRLRRDPLDESDATVRVDRALAEIFPA